MATSVKRLRIHGWRQFGDVSIDFHEALTVLTGANGSGKTTILELLAKHLAWPRTYYGLSYRRPDGTFAFFLSYHEEGKWADIGEIEYSDGQSAQLQVPTIAPAGVTASYDLAIRGQQNFPGLYLTSHRSGANYSKTETIPASFQAPNQLFDKLMQEVRRRHAGQHSPKSPFAWMKESLIAAAIYGEGSRSVRADPIAERVWTEFQRVLGFLLPPSLGFQRLIVDAPEVIVETTTDAFPIEESSGGVAALMELGWQILLRSFDESDFVVLVDEPENHLHPELQRQLIPSLLDAFPDIQFIVATHSPFVVTSVADSNVYVLDYDQSGKVVSRLLDQVNKAASADETLQRVLGLESTMPQWAETAFSQVLDRYSTLPLTAESMVELRSELERLGVVSEFPDAVLAALRGRDATP